ncbi:MAG: amidohydrolase family protein [Acidimicrobiales bacterium]
MLLRAKWLFDGRTLSSLSDPLVEIRDGRITRVGDSGPAMVGSEPVLDLGEVTLLPGLIDGHQHLGFDASSDPVATFMADSDAMLLLRMRLAALRALSVGITTIRDLGDRSYLGVELRDWFLRGGEVGPEILAAGPPITVTKGHCWFMGGEADGVDGVRQAVRDHVSRGVDVIKIMTTGGNMTPTLGPHESQYTLAEITAVVDEAHAHGLLVAAHGHGTQGIADSLAAGVDSIEHCTFLNADGVDDAANIIAELGRSQTFVSLSLGTAPGDFEPPFPAMVRRRPAIMANHTSLCGSGARIVCGTDAGVARTKPHDVLPYGVEHLSLLGLTNAAALRAVTSVAAEYCGVADRKGNIAVGMDADLVAVKGNVVEDLAKIHDVVAVFRAGQRVSLPPR